VQELLAFAGIVGALAVGVVSPGPSFVMVAREAVSVSRGNGVAAAVGMGLGGAMFALAALVGLQAALLAVPLVYAGLKVIGGLYLGYLGYRIFSGAKRPLDVGNACADARRSRHGSFWLGLTTQISNPKTAIVYASVFAAFLPGRFSPAFAVALLCVVFALETGWYAIVAALLSSDASRRVYLGYKVWIDRSAGLIMMGLGLRLIGIAGRN
jgi:threonine efflux protein